MFCRGSVVILADLACAAVAAVLVFGGIIVCAELGVQDPSEPPPFAMLAMEVVLGAIGGVLAGGVLFALTLVVEGFRRLFKARWWAASLVAVPAFAAFAAAVAWLVGATPEVTLGVAVSAFAAFAAYWHAYLVAQVLLTRIVDRLLPNRICAVPPAN